MKYPNPWDWDLPTAYWTVWFIMFLVGEYLFRDGEMLSHHIWYARNRGPSVVVFMMAALLAWINYHFLREGWDLFASRRGRG